MSDLMPFLLFISTGDARRLPVLTAVVSARVVGFVVGGGLVCSFDTGNVLEVWGV